MSRQYRIHRWIALVKDMDIAIFEIDSILEDR